MLSTILRILLPLIGVAFASKVIFLSIASSSSIPLLSSDGIYSLLYGLRFDATAGAALAAPIIIAALILHYTKINGSRLVKTLVIAGSIWLIGTTMSDTIYSLDANKHVTFELFTSKGLELELIRTAFSLHWHLILVGIILMLLTSIAIWKSNLVRCIQTRSTKLNFSLSIIVWLLFTVTAIRGGWMDHPQSPMSAYNIGDNDRAFIAWSAPYSVTYHLAKGAKKSASNVTQPASSELHQELAQTTTSPAILDNLKDANIVFVLLESWVSIDMKSYGSDIDSSPFFDALREKSLTSHAMYADGYRTVQGMFASMCSFPNPNGGIVASTQLQNNQYYCLPHMLKDRGWDTRFIQGSGKGLVGAFAKTLGFTESYGKMDYDFDDETNEWGYMDGGIYRYSLDRLDEMQAENPDKPFFMMINTGTTHSVYLPESFGYPFGDDNMSQIRASVQNHADIALHEFLAQLEGRFDKPTLVVLMSDHTAKVSEPDLAKNSIPFLIYATDGSIPSKQIDTAVSQRDIGVTILDWMGGYAPWFTGQSLLQEQEFYRSSFSDGSLFYWVDNRHAVTINSPDGQLKQCFTIEDNTISLTKADCNAEWVQPLYQQGRDFNNLTQQLLFDGKTLDYRHLASIFPQSSTELEDESQLVSD
ncbi:LTA synthase family protein [Vibrio europaeus]|uniref:LTA synthase family protein n=1 Tax=Vibrio europaeus TaxID=300876 RepID=UPI001E432954|nr:LTA synthase family protein [Vibrio europaeus]MDC5804579.1 LTA synthase family protein [Vibrio europaeus]MDC5808573.1 LTA synthase family protein [Vibrio europaeus]MDC5825167.1 LTA synthase family protein [Vibrio europaeus]MDC5829460.1 LTA synthase family protein [Vibrio europaeus]MDC5836122.1 LTA synthase family protein [Vibrio europaeus]